jgi:hypothetical protein
MNKAIPGLLALLALGACAADTRDRSATPTAAEPEISPRAR